MRTHLQDHYRRDDVMSGAQVGKDLRSMWRWIGGSAFMATMCCFPSVVLVLFGLASVSTAAALSNDLYWGTNGMGWFRPTLMVLSAALLATGLVLFFRREGICTLDEVKRQRRRVFNTSLVVALIGLLAYVLFNFVLLTELGIALELPWESSRLWN